MTLIWDLRNLFGIKDETSVDLEISSKAATHQHDSTPMLASTTIIFILSKFFNIRTLLYKSLEASDTFKGH